MHSEYTSFQLDENVVPFAVGCPDPMLLPLDVIQQATMRAFEGPVKQEPFTFQYGKMIGADSFREHMAKFLSDEYQMKIGPGQVALCAGASAAIGVVAQKLRRMNEEAFPLEKGNRDVLCEVPTYFHAEKMLVDAGCKPVGIPSTGYSDESAMGLVWGVETELAGRQKVGKAPPAFIYVIPTFHNPTGASLSTRDVLELACLAEKYGTYIVCDEPYNLLTFGANPMPQMMPIVQGHAGEERVISIGSFSKIVAPGLRCGWVLANETTLERVYCSGGSVISGGCTNPFAGLVVTEMMKGPCELKTVVANAREILGKRFSVFETEMKAANLDNCVRVPSGGYFAWIRLGNDRDGNPIDSNSQEFKSKCSEHGVQITPGIKCVIESATTFDSSRDHSLSKCIEKIVDSSRNSIRICVAATPEQQVRMGVQRLAKVIRHFK